MIYKLLVQQNLLNASHFLQNLIWTPDKNGGDLKKQIALLLFYEVSEKYNPSRAKFCIEL